MPARRSDVTARRRGNLMRLLHGVYPERGHKRFFASLRMTKSEGFAMTLCVCQVIYDFHCNPSVSGVFIPLWQRGGVKKLEYVPLTLPSPARGEGEQTEIKKKFPPP